MRSRGRQRWGKRVGTSQTRDGHTIVSITDDGAGKVKITTLGPHGFTSDNLISGDIARNGMGIVGTSVSGYNVTTSHVDSVVSATAFVTSAAYTADAAGGRWYSNRAADAAGGGGGG